MDKDFLTEYNKKEQEGIERRLRLLKKDDLNYGTIIGYDKRRLGNIKEPVSNQARSVNQPIWPEIPFSNTLIVQLLPVPENQFYYYHGFYPSDIEQLIEYSKIGKIKFIIRGNPTHFNHLDFLYEIFIECNPPVADYYAYSNEKTSMYQSEFIKSASKALFPSFQAMAQQDKLELPIDYYEQFISLYLNLKMNKYDYICKVIMDNIINNIDISLSILNFSNNLPIVHPIDFSWNNCCNLESFSGLKYLDLIEAEKCSKIPFDFTYDIGSFLMKKSIPYPISSRGCELVLEKYNDTDYTNVYRSLNKLVLENNIDSLIDKSNDFEIVLNNIWEESKALKMKSNILDVGLSVGIGALGIFSAGITGLLPAISYLFLKDTFKKGSGTISKKILQKFYNPSLFTIYNFQKSI